MGRACEVMIRGMGRILAAGALLALSLHRAAATGPTPAELISSFRLRHGEIRVTVDPTLNRIAQAQARAMAEQDRLDHSVYKSFSARIAPSRAGLAAENIAYGYDSFDKTLGQWIASSEHRKNLLLHNATRIGIASAKDASGRRTYWAMEIAGDYEPRPSKRKKGVLVAVREPEVVVVRKRVVATCHVRLLGLCL